MSITAYFLSTLLLFSRQALGATKFKLRIDHSGWGCFDCYGETIVTSYTGFLARVDSSGCTQDYFMTISSWNAITGLAGLNINGYPTSHNLYAGRYYISSTDIFGACTLAYSVEVLYTDDVAHKTCTRGWGEKLSCGSYTDPSGRCNVPVDQAFALCHQYPECEYVQYTDDPSWNSQNTNLAQLVQGPINYDPSNMTFACDKDCHGDTFAYEFDCPGYTSFAGYCVVPIQNARLICALLPECEYISSTYDTSWNSRFPNSVQLTKGALRPGFTKWWTCKIDKPTAQTVLLDTVEQPRELKLIQREKDSKVLVRKSTLGGIGGVFGIMLVAFAIRRRRNNPDRVSKSDDSADKENNSAYI